MTQDDPHEEMVELLKNQLQGFKCTVCGQNEFVHLDLFEQGLQSNLMLFKGDDPVAKRHVSLQTIACTNCGHLEQFAEPALRKRLLGAVHG